MACCETLIANLAREVADLTSCPQPCQIPCQIEPPVPYATCCMVCPPPILAPTQPMPVKPLQLPCPLKRKVVEQYTEEEMMAKRYSNFYNNYNVDYHPDPCKPPPPMPEKRKRCREEKEQKLPGCPRGFKPCEMKLTPPPGNHPCGVWCARIQPCPPKPRVKVPYDGRPEACTRPCCKHWKPKEKPCLYDCPCPASCFNHPIGIKPGRAPKCCPPLSYYIKP